MKTILYIVAIVAIAVGAFFSFQTRTKFQEVVDTRAQLEQENSRIASRIDKTETEFKQAREERDAARDLVAQQDAELDRLKLNERTVLRDVAELDATLEGFAAQLAELEAIRNEIGQILGEAGVTLESLPAELERIELELEEKRLAREKMAEMVEEAESTIARSESEAARLQRRIASRAESIGQNSLQTVVTAVNSNWGFAVIGAGARAGVTPESRFLVERGGRVIARLVPTSVEASQTIADIDRNSVDPGVVVRPGDRVIFQNVNR